MQSSTITYNLFIFTILQYCFYYIFKDLTVASLSLKLPPEPSFLELTFRFPFFLQCLKFCIRSAYRNTIKNKQINWWTSNFTMTSLVIKIFIFSRFRKMLWLNSRFLKPFFYWFRIFLFMRMGWETYIFNIAIYLFEFKRRRWRFILFRFSEEHLVTEVKA